MRGNGLDLGAQRYGPAASSPIGAGVRIKPEQRGGVQSCEDLRQHGSAIALVHPHVLRAVEPDAGKTREGRLELDRLDAIEIPSQRPGGLAHIRACLDEDPQPMLSRRVAQQLSLWGVAMTPPRALVFLHRAAETVERRNP